MQPSGLYFDAYVIFTTDRKQDTDTTFPSSVMSVGVLRLRAIVPAIVNAARRCLPPKSWNRRMVF